MFCIDVEALMNMGDVMRLVMGTRVCQVCSDVAQCFLWMVFWQCKIVFSVVFRASLVLLVLDFGEIYIVLDVMEVDIDINFDEICKVQKWILK